MVLILQIRSFVQSIRAMLWAQSEESYRREGQRRLFCSLSEFSVVAPLRVHLVSTTPFKDKTKEFEDKKLGLE